MKQKPLVSAITGLLAMSALCLHSAQAGSLEITVDSFSDVPEAGLTTFRQAIEQANNNPDSVILFDETVFSEPRRIVLESGELNLLESTVVLGPGADLLTVDANQLSRNITIGNFYGYDRLSADSVRGGFYVPSVTIADITFTGGNDISVVDNASVNGLPGLLGTGSVRGGGCIASFADLNLTRTVVTGCSSTSRGGGVLSVYSSLVIDNSEISDNYAENYGGGVSSSYGDLVVFQSTISNNTLRGNTEPRGFFSGFGGGIAARGSNLNTINSTISGNQALNLGASGISIYTPVFLTKYNPVVKGSGGTTLQMSNSTVVNNSGTGVELLSGGEVLISHTIIASNSGQDCDFDGADSSSSVTNSLDTDGSCDVFSTGHITVDDPMLGSLANYGGFTETHRPEPGSPVIDAGDGDLCSNSDQRGEIRPQDGDGDGSAVCDIGAVEVLVVEDIIFINGFDN